MVKIIIFFRHNLIKTKAHWFLWFWWNEIEKQGFLPQFSLRKDSSDGKSRLAAQQAGLSRTKTPALVQHHWNKTRCWKKVSFLKPPHTAVSSLMLHPPCKLFRLNTVSILKTPPKKRLDKLYLTWHTINIMMERYQHLYTSNLVQNHQLLTPTAMPPTKALNSCTSLIYHSCASFLPVYRREPAGNYAFLWCPPFILFSE